MHLHYIAQGDTNLKNASNTVLRLTCKAQTEYYFRVDGMGKIKISLT